MSRGVDSRAFVAFNLKRQKHDFKTPNIESIVHLAPHSTKRLATAREGKRSAFCPPSSKKAWGSNRFKVCFLKMDRRLIFRYLGLECVALADRKVEERISLSCAWIHHCHQLVDALPGDHRCEDGHQG